MSSIRAILFDAGNTLLREVPSRFEIYTQVGRNHGLEVDTARMRESMRRANAALPSQIDGHYRYTQGWFLVYVDLVYSGLGYRGPVEPLLADLNDVFSRGETFRLFPETRAVVKRLKGAGIPLGIVSNWSPRLPGILGKVGLAADFDVIVTSAIARMEKPDGAIFHRAAGGLRVPPERCLFVGDHPVKDVDGAQAAGLRALLLDRERRHLDHPERIDSLEAVLEVVGLPRL